MNRLSFPSIVLLFCLSLLTPSCSDKYGGDNKDPDLLQTGRAIEVSSISIGTTGGSIMISKPGTPVDGMEIVVPANAYPSGKTFTISYAEIESHPFGEFFNPISPLITISNGGGYANELMTVEIPVEIPKGFFAMGFLYNEVTGELEGMPLLAIKEKSVVVATRHFATSSLGGKSLVPSLKGMNKTAGDAVLGNLIISAISIEKLKKQTDIESGFEPGHDDWEFTNYGSILASPGICSGMCLSAMWYYSEEASNGNSKLFHKYDKYTIANYSNLWQDNTLGIKLSSMVQLDYKKNNKAYEKAIDALARDKSKDSLSWYAFAYSILQTKQPQFIGLMSSAGGGHVIIANDVGMQDGKLWISDPNHPGNKSLNILYTDKEFEPYYASLNAAENPFNFEYIAYYGKTAVVDWSLVSQRWAELNDGTIGNVFFPDLKLWVEDPTGNTAGWKLADEFKTDLDTLSLHIMNNWHLDYAFTVYDQEGYAILPDPKGNFAWVDSGEIILKPGLNIIGYCIMVKTLNQLGEEVWDWTDFQWMDVYYSKLRIEPNPISGEPAKDIKITARSGGTAPKEARYVWNFGDGTAEITVINDSIVKHKFPLVGNFTVSVKLYDNSNSTLLGTASAEAEILTGCGDGSFTDSRDGHVYKFKTIGTQTWMIENLAYLPSVSPFANESESSPYYYVYDYKGSNVADAKATANYFTNGVLYNWPAALIACPAGWHLPSDEEWNTLTTSLGGDQVAGAKMKEEGTTHWSPNAGATNESCFTVLPGGIRDIGARGFSGLGGNAFIWSSTEYGASTAWLRSLRSINNKAEHSYYARNAGMSVRCLKN